MLLFIYMIFQQEQHGKNFRFTWIYQFRAIMAVFYDREFILYLKLINVFFKSVASAEDQFLEEQFTRYFAIQFNLYSFTIYC